MIAYNNEWLGNLLVRRQADKALNNNCISTEERDKVYAAYTAPFYTPNIFVRIGLFVLTWVILIFTMGLFSLMLMSGRETTFGSMFLFFGALAYGALEFMVSKGHYRSGVDDGLLWAAGICVITGINLLANTPMLVNAIIVFAIAFFLFLRFKAALMAGIALLALLAILFYAGLRLGSTAQLVLPFVLMVASTILYFLCHSQLQSGKWPYYTNGLMVASITALLGLYLAGNYYVVREASVSLLNMQLKEGERLPFGWLFWFFTVAIPLVYIVSGIQKKDALLLRVGLLLVTAIVFTVRYYYHVLPAEIAMVTGGIGFIIIAYALIKYLQQPKYGFTYLEQSDPFLMDKLQVESLVIVQSFTGPATATPDSGTQFGGGTGSGGGASGEF